MEQIRTIETDSTPVEVTGTAPREILWRGKQWAVTTFGIEALDGDYSIAAGRLDENFSDWSWIMQLGAKSWVDIPDFTTAFMVAIVLHGKAPGFDRAQIMKDFGERMRKREQQP